MENNIPRSSYMPLWTPAEKMIQDAVWEVEKMGADVRLTKAVNLLAQARAAVADFVDNTEPAATIQAIREATNRHTTSPEAAREFLQEAGIKEEALCLDAAHDYASAMVWINRDPDSQQAFYEYISRQSFIAGAKWAARQTGIEENNGWIDVKDSLPEANGKTYPVLITDGKKRYIAYYFPEHFKTVEWEDWDDYNPEDFPYTENDEVKGVVWLRPGFYHEVECDKCEVYWSAPITATHWQPLPALLKQNSKDNGK